MWEPKYRDPKFSPYYKNDAIQNADLPDGFSEAICDYISSRFLISKSDSDALLNDLAKEVAECIDDDYIEEVKKTAREVLAFRLCELARQKIECETRKSAELMQKSCIGLIDEGFVKKVLSFAEHNKNE